jgi:hypothetical protein
MNPTKIIERAAADGVLLGLSPSGDISAKGAPSAIDGWLPAIRQSKAEIVLLLRPRGDGWSIKDWQAFFDERAAIAEFDGGLMRAEAVARAFECCIAEWLIRNPEHLPADHRFGCGGSEHPRDRLLPVGAGGASQVWANSCCYPAWNAARKAEAVALLKAMGITPPGDFPDDFVKNGRA